MNNRQNSVMTNAWVSFISEGRSGTVYYMSAETSFDMWYEVASSPALVFIDIPKPQCWEKRTGTPLAHRAQILDFIGERVVKRQAPGGHFTVQDDTLVIYSGPKA